jgi:hypothetical protein
MRVEGGYSMKRRILIILGFIVVGLAGTGIYLNYQLDHLLNQPGVLSALENDTTSAPDGNQAGVGSNTASPGGSGSQAGVSQPNSGSSVQKDLVSDIENKVGQPVAKQDLLKAGVILMRRLNAEDIRYLKNVALQGSYSPEEYRHAQEILLDRLSGEDINALKKLGAKYGNDLKILNPPADPN